MKKKGLIISTVVMVVILIASLTTATYAWFSSTSTARVGDIEMSATSSNKLVIGVAPDNSGTLPTAVGGWLSGTATWTPGSETTSGKWEGAPGLGPQIDFMTGGKDSAALNFALSKAVTVAAGGERLNADDEAQVATAGDFIKASGEGLVVEKIPGTETELYAATSKNVDYFDATIVALPVSAGEVKQSYCEIRVKPTDAAKIGMAAAIRFSVTVDGGTATVIDAYKGKTYKNGWNESTLEQGAIENTNEWVYIIELKPWNATGYGTDFAAANYSTIRIQAWIEGTDESCVSANAGTGGTISISFNTYDAEHIIDAKGVSTAKAAG